MTQVAATTTTTTTRTQPFTPSGLRTEAKALHKSSVNWMNAGWLCVLASFGLSVLGVVAIGTVTRPGEPDYAMRQAVFLLVGMLAAAVVAAPHYRVYERLSYPAMFVALGLLLFVLIPFVPEAIVRPRNGARRWINIGVSDFQPSELAKITYVLVLATYLRARSNHRTLTGLLMLLGLTFIPLALVLAEPDLGTALLFFPTLFAMVIVAGARMRHIVLIIAIGLAAAPAAYPFLRPHQKDRINAMIAQVKGDPRYENDIGYQGARAMTLVGAGGLTGVGKEAAAELIRYNHLPEDHNDMVFAVICCRWGLLGALVTWGLFALFLVGGLLTAGLCKDPFGRLVAVGIVAVLMAQMAINTGMTIGLLPITGMTLPFISYGGSSLVAAWLMIGLLLNVGLRRPRFMWRKSFEFDEVQEPDA